MTLHILLSALLAAAALAPSSAARSAETASGLCPRLSAARSRGPAIFNAVHDAMRQWGSSLHHNGMSIFVATVPEGVLLHHGNDRAESPTEPDWLAFEIEHAEEFASGRTGPPRKPGGDGDGPRMGGGGQRVVSAGDGDGDGGGEGGARGWLHVYRTTRPLPLLYVDGMAAGKTIMGTLDTQDYLLRADRTRMEGRFRDRRVGGGPMDEHQRALDLCAMCKEWGLQGILRMEAGFEIIKCDFSDGLEQVQALRRRQPSRTPGSGKGSVWRFEQLRGLAERYGGIGSSRVVVDYSSMVSAFFFPVNLTNPDAKRPDLPRLSSTTYAELAAIKQYLVDTIASRRESPRRAIDWQDVADIIVARYSDRIQYMAEKVTSATDLAEELDFLLDVYVDYPAAGEAVNVTAAIERCTGFYLQPVAPVTGADRLIHTAFEAIAAEICSTLFRARETVADADGDDDAVLAEALASVRGLMRTLDWAPFKSCRGCAIDEVCVVPMWPSGTVEDYLSPQCGNGSRGHDGESYWGGFRPRPPGERGEKPIERGGRL